MIITEVSRSTGMPIWGCCGKRYMNKLQATGHLMAKHGVEKLDAQKQLVELLQHSKIPRAKEVRCKNFS